MVSDFFFFWNTPTVTKGGGHEFGLLYAKNRSKRVRYSGIAVYFKESKTKFYFVYKFCILHNCMPVSLMPSASFYNV